MKNNQKNFVIGLLIAIIIILVIGGGVYLYKSKNIEVPVTVNTEVKSLETTDGAPKTQVKNTSLISITKGKYQFEELSGSGPNAQTWVYDLNIENNGGVGKMILNIDGFQTLSRINAKGVASKGSIEVVFESYGPDNMFTPYKKGDVLFTLTPTANGLAFKWNKMQPSLPFNQAGGYFVLRSN